MAFLEQFQQFITWMVLSHPILLFVGGAVGAWLGPTLLVWSSGWYRRTLRWTPPPATQQRLLTAAGWMRYAHYGAMGLVAVLTIVMVSMTLVNLARFSLAWTSADLAFVGKMLGLVVGALGLVWWTLRCLITGLEQIFRMWGTSPPDFSKKPTAGAQG